MKHDEFPVTVLGARPNRRHGLSRSDVVSRPKIRKIGEVKKLGDVLG